LQKQKLVRWHMFACWRHLMYENYNFWGHLMDDWCIFPNLHKSADHVLVDMPAWLLSKRFEELSTWRTYTNLQISWRNCLMRTCLHACLLLSIIHIIIVSKKKWNNWVKLVISCLLLKKVLAFEIWVLSHSFTLLFNCKLLQIWGKFIIFSLQLVFDCFVQNRISFFFHLIIYVNTHTYLAILLYFVLRMLWMKWASYM